MKIYLDANAANLKMFQDTIKARKKQTRKIFQKLRLDVG